VLAQNSIYILANSDKTCIIVSDVACMTSTTTTTTTTSRDRNGNIKNDAHILADENSVEYVDVA
jgi:hypothetical protein